MTLLANEKIIMGHYNTAKVLNTFFSNIVSNLNIPEYSNCEPLANNISDPILKCVVKFKKSKNRKIEKSNFPSSLKKANIAPVFNKSDRNSKDNYRPVSILPNISKIFERCIFRQLYRFMFEFLSKYQCGFAKGIVRSIAC